MKDSIIVILIAAIMLILSAIMTVLYIGKSRDYKELNKYSNDITLKYSRLLESFSVDSVYYVTKVGKLSRANDSLRAQLTFKEPAKLKIVYKTDTTVMLDSNYWEYMPLTSYTDSLSDDAITIRWRNIVLGEVLSTDMDYTLKEKTIVKEHIVYRDLPPIVKKKHHLYADIVGSTDQSAGAGLTFVTKKGRGLGAGARYKFQESNWVFDFRYVQRIF
jgi:hypothetical protein